MPTEPALAEEFSRFRAHLLALGYQLTGSVADAEDALQETWLRLAKLSDSQRGELRDLEAWSTTVLSRICLDRLRSAAVRRERYVGQWLPEPIVTAPAAAASTDPLAAAVADEDLRMAAMAVLEHLTPEQRVAFVLHHAFDLPFAEIADVLGCSQAAARQHGSRGKRALAQADPPPRADEATQRDVLERFTAATRAGDIQAVAEVLHPDVALIGDGGGKAKTALRVMTGADKIARFLRGLLELYEPAALAAGKPVLVNGDLGLYLPASPASEGYRALDAHVQTSAIRDGKVVTIYDLANPDKLIRLP